MIQLPDDRPLVTFEGVSLKVGEDLAFAETNWTIREGEHWAVLGSNGSGKSLLAQALLRRVPLAVGRIRYSFDDPSRPSSYFASGQIRLVSAERQRELVTRYSGYVQARWQSSERDRAPAVRDLLLAGVGDTVARPTSEAPQIMAEAITALDIDRLLDRKIISLSSGELRKLALAEALLDHPRLLILDDPFPGLDQESERSLRRVLEVLCRQTRPVLMLVTSRPEDVPEGITHVALVAQSRIARTGRRQWALGAAELQDLTNPRAVPETAALVESPSSVRDPVIEMRGVTVRYAEATILEGVDWVVREGEKWAILGPNGAGKTTLLSLVLGDNPQAYTNDIRLFGVRRGSGESIWDIKKQIGWVSSELQLFYPPEANALDVICSGFFDSVGLYRACVSEQIQLARRWAEDLGVSGQLARPYYSLSAGERRLVLLARALVKLPRLLVLDEPAQGLDAQHLMRFREKLDWLCGVQPTTLLYVTHRLEELPSGINRVLRLDKGRVVAPLGGALQGLRQSEER
jgi:molybdate transport system ATP-binding protein